MRIIFRDKKTKEVKPESDFSGNYAVDAHGKVIYIGSDEDGEYTTYEEDIEAIVKINGKIHKIN